MSKKCKKYEISYREMERICLRKWNKQWPGGDCPWRPGTKCSEEECHELKELEEV